MISEKAVADVQREVWERVGWKFSDESARQLIEAVLSVLPLHEDQQAEINRLRADNERLRIAGSALLVEYVEHRKEGNVDSFPMTARRIVRDMEAALIAEKDAKS